MICLYQEFCSRETSLKKWTNKQTPQKTIKETSIKIHPNCNAMGNWRELPERGKGSGSSKHFWLCLGGAVGGLQEKTIPERFPAVTELIEHVSQVKRTRLRNHSGTVFHFNICPQGSQLLFFRSQRGDVTALEVHVLFLAAFQIHSLHL